MPTHPELLNVSSPTSVLIVINEPCLPTASQNRQVQLQSWLGGNKSLGYDSDGIFCPWDGTAEESSSVEFTKGFVFIFPSFDDYLMNNRMQKEKYTFYDLSGFYVAW